MSSLNERIENDKKLVDIITSACLGNTAAEQYLYGIAKITRTYDDLIDKDVMPSDDDIFFSLHFLWVGIFSNPFFIQHCQTLVSVHNVAFNAWVDSTAWEKSGNELKKKYAHVIRDTIGELIAIVSFLVGGYTHMRKMSIYTRECFLKKEGE